MKIADKITNFAIKTATKNVHLLLHKLTAKVH